VQPFQSSVHRASSSELIPQLIQKFSEARSLGSLKYAYQSAMAEVGRILGARIGPSERPEERELREAFRAAYHTIVREGRRKYQRDYMRRWRAANPEKAKVQNRRDAQVYRAIRRL
jgi:hypothetical protein